MKKFLLTFILFYSFSGLIPNVFGHPGTNRYGAGKSMGGWCTDPSRVEGGTAPAGQFLTREECGVETVVFRFLPGDDMFYVRASEGMEENAAKLKSLFGFIDEYRAAILSGRIPVRVDSYCASLSDRVRNKNTAFVRANRVKSELITHKGLTEANFVTTNHASGYTDNRGVEHKDAVVVTITVPVPEADPYAAPAPVVDKEPEINPHVAEQTPEPEPRPQTVPIVESRPAETAVFDIHTNLLYDAVLTPTLGVGMRIGSFGVKIDGSWAHWGNSGGRVQKLWLVSPEFRWHLLESKRLYVGIGANFGEANIYKGLANVLSKETGYQGTLYGGGITVGYRVPLGSRFEMDFNLGLGVTHLKYDTFYLSNGVRVYRVHDVSKNIWGPTQAGVTLVWNLWNKN